MSPAARAAQLRFPAEGHATQLVGRPGENERKRTEDVEEFIYHSSTNTGVIRRPARLPGGAGISAPGCFLATSRRASARVKQTRPRRISWGATSISARPRANSFKHTASPSVASKKAFSDRRGRDKQDNGAGCPQPAIGQGPGWHRQRCPLWMGSKDPPKKPIRANAVEVEPSIPVSQGSTSDFSNRVNILPLRK